MSSICYLYWIHLPEVHTDVTTHGYIGITTQTVANRFKAHRYLAKSGKKTHLYDAMRKYGESVEVKTLILGTVEFCQFMENKLRPDFNIGWNTGIGGDRPTVGYRHSADTLEKIAEAGRVSKHTEESRAKIGAAHKGKQVSEDTRLKQSAIRKGRQADWCNPSANKEVWAIADKVFEHLSLYPEHGVCRVGKAVSLTKDKVAKIVAKIKTGWNPLEDESWLTFKANYSKENYGSQSVET